MSPGDDENQKQPNGPDVAQRLADHGNANLETNLDRRSTIDEAVDPKVLKALELLANVRQLGDATKELDEIPRYIGRYQISESVGRGGFSEVFRAVDEDLSREVALKVPLIVGRPDCQLRFEREAKLAAMLSHRQIVPVYEFGCVGKVDFIAYAWIEGVTLGEWLATQGGKVSDALSSEIVAKLARAMHYAHERGVVHRDLKPSNILVDQSAEAAELPIQMRTRITDLGLSRDIFDKDQRLTQTGQALGTPGYMSPEQAQGKDTTVGADIYSMGVILFELLTGKLPFERDNAVETLKAIVDDPAPLVSKLESGTSRELAAIVDKCLQKDADSRYRSAFELAEDLEAFVSGRPVSVRPAGMLRRCGKWVARNRSLTATIALVTFSLLAGTSVSTWNWLDSKANLQLAEEQGERADRFLMRAQETMDRLVGDISRDPKLPVDVRLGALMQAISLQQELLAEASDDIRIVRRSVKLHREHGRLLQELGRFEPAIDAYDEAILLAEPFLDDEQIAGQITHANRDRASALSGTGRIDEAGEALDSIENPNLLAEARTSFTRSIRFLNYSNEPKKAIAELERCIELYSELPGDGSVQFERAKAINFLGIANHNLGEFAVAIEKFRLAMPTIDETVDVMPDNKPVVDEAARCHFFLSDSMLAQIKLGDISGEAKGLALVDAKKHCDIAAEYFRELADLKYRAAPGQLIACYDLGLQIERQLGNMEGAVEQLELLEGFYRDLPEDYLHRSLIGGVVAQQYLQLAKDFVDDDPPRSEELLGEAEALADELIEKHGLDSVPGLKEVVSGIAEFKEGSGAGN